MLKFRILRRLKTQYRSLVPMCLVGTLIGLAVQYGPVGSFLFLRVVQATEFKVRAYLGRDPKLDSSIKIYGYDDKTLAQRKTAELELNEWGTLLNTIAKAKPKLIMIDKLFGSPGSLGGYQEFVNLVKGTGVPVVIASFVSPSPIPFRDEISLTRPEFDLRGLIAAGSVGEKDEEIRDYDWLTPAPARVYGTIKEIEGAFARIGHVVYFGEGLVDSFIRVGQDNVVPHWSLLAADVLAFDAGAVYANGYQVPVGPSGELAVNFISPDILRRSIYSIYLLIERSKRGDDVSDVIAAGQIVIILPALFTGNTDMVMTPYGVVPGGQVVTSLVNSVITGQWIIPSRYSTLWILASAVLGCLLGGAFPTLWFWIILAAAELTLAALAIGSFAYLGMRLPWFPTDVALAISGIGAFALRVLDDERQYKRLKAALHGLIPNERLARILETPQKLHLEPVGRVVSIMFIDMVGFSLTTERQKPEEAFAQIREFLRSMADIIHNYDGIIDKSLGDGLLCFFGYDLSGGPSTDDHADKALECAIAIQRMSVERILASTETPKAIYPIRIGINSSSVFIGDIGDTRRRDITMIGDGVNFASRLESACEPFRIMMGPATRDLLLRHSRATPAIEKRPVKIKHHHSLFEAFEYDPYCDVPEIVTQAAQLYKVYAKLERTHDRIVAEDTTMRVFSAIGDFSVVDYSPNGLGLVGPIYLARGVVVSIRIDNVKGTLAKVLQSRELNPFTIEVRWGQVIAKGKYRLGCEIVGLNAEQKSLIFDTIETIDQKKMEVI